MGIILSLQQIPNEMLLDLRTKKETSRELGEVKSIEIDKSYEGIHFLLTGTAGWEGKRPASSLMTGQELDICSETVLSLDSEEVKAFNSYIQGISSEELKLNYDPKKMNELGIYPGNYNNSDEVISDLDYLLEYYNDLKDFIKESANDNYALLLIFA